MVILVEIALLIESNPENQQIKKYYQGLHNLYPLFGSTLELYTELKYLASFLLMRCIMNFDNYQMEEDNKEMFLFY
jgi:hypothetical protein